MHFDDAPGRPLGRQSRENAGLGIYAMGEYPFAMRITVFAVPSLIAGNTTLEMVAADGHNDFASDCVICYMIHSDTSLVFSILIIPQVGQFVNRFVKVFYFFCEFFVCLVFYPRATV